MEPVGVVMGVVNEWGHSTCDMMRHWFFVKIFMCLWGGRRFPPR